MLRELLAKFDVDTGKASEKLKSFDKDLSHIKSAMAHVGGALATTFSVSKVAAFLKEQIDLGGAIVDTAAKLGVGTDELQKFQHGAGLVGVSAEAAGQALGFLNKNMGEALSGGAEQAKTFAEMHVALKNADGSVRELGDVIPEIADAFAGMGSQQERTAAAMKIFGKSGAALLPLLQQGATGIRELDAEFARLGGGMQKDFLEAADRAGDEFDRLKFAMTGLKSRIALAVLPTLADLAKRLQGEVGWLQKMTKETNIVKLGWAAFAAIAVASSAKIAVGFAKMLGVLPKGGNIWTSLFKMGEIGLIIAAVIALALVFEDLWVMINGGDSVIGDIIESLFGVGAKQELINEVTGAFSKMKDEVLALKPIVEEFGRLFVAIWPYAKVAIEFVAKAMLSGLGMAFKTLGAMVDFAMKNLATMLQQVGKFSASAGELLGNDSLKELGISAAKAGVSIATAAAPRPSAVFGGERATLEGLQQTNNIDITVQGGTTNAETGRAVAGAVKDAKTQNEKNAAAAAMKRSAPSPSRETAK